MSKQIKSLPILLIDRDLIAVFVLKIALIFLLVEEEIVLGGVVGPDVFDRFVDFTLVFYLLQVFEHFERRTRTYCIVDEFIFRCGPGGIFEFLCQFKRPIHSHNIFKFPIVNGLFVLKGC